MINNLKLLLLFLCVWGLCEAYLLNSFIEAEPACAAVFILFCSSHTKERWRWGYMQEVSHGADTNWTPSFSKKKKKKNLRLFTPAASFPAAPHHVITGTPDPSLWSVTPATPTTLTAALLCFSSYLWAVTCYLARLGICMTRHCIIQRILCNFRLNDVYNNKSKKKSLREHGREQ